MNRGCSNKNEKRSVPNKYIKALHCPTRWDIIEIIGDGEKSTKEIRIELESLREGLTSSNLYYHLSELKDAGIIEVSKYREEGGGAPEKVWKLARKSIEIRLIPEDE